MSAEFTNTSGTNCFRNNQCISGYCKSGRCANPSSSHHPCNPFAQNCPDSLKCSNFSRTCVPSNYFQKYPCKSSSDCTFNQRCGSDGNCKAMRQKGTTCNIEEEQICEMGSLCALVDDDSQSSKCYEKCSFTIPCSPGYKCKKFPQTEDSICIPRRRSSNRNSTSSNDNISLSQREIFQALVIVILAIIILLGLLSLWIRFTRGEKDPRLWNDSGKKKKKKLRLNIEANGLATITVIPSNPQSPQPVAASQLFSSSDAPPAYSEVIQIR